MGKRDAQDRYQAGRRLRAAASRPPSSPGGKTVWLAGQTTTTDLKGHDIAGNFDEQARTIFALINRTLERAGGSLANLVTMTVFINDARYGDRFVASGREHLPDARYPCSALLTISAFARPAS